MNKTTISTLQGSIDKRAEDKLDRDLKAICAFVEEHPILSRTGNSSKDEGFPVVYMQYGEGDKLKYESTTFYWLFKFMSRQGGQSTSNYMQRLKAHLLPDYIKAETDEFLNRIDQLEEDTNYLLNKD